jgi:hypothetical protein
VPVDSGEASPSVYADHDLLAAFDRGDAAQIGFDQLLLHVAGIDGGDGAAHAIDAHQFGARRGFELIDLGRDLGGAVEDVAEFQQVGLVRHDLLQAQRPLLVPRARQAQRFVPRRQLDGAGPCFLRQHHGQHLEQDAIDVVLRLLLGQAERIDLHSIAEQQGARIGDAIALAADLFPQFGEGAHLAQFGDELDSGIDEEGDAREHLGEIGIRHLAGGFHRIEDGDGVGQRESQLLHRRRTRFLQMIGADIHRVPLGNLAIGEGDDVGGELQRRLRREDISAARKIFLDDVVLRRALQRLAVDAVAFGAGDIERQQPGCRRVDGHRRVHLVERDAVEQRLHVAQMADRHADLADLATRQHVIAVVAGLRRQIEGDGQAGLTARQIGAIEFVRFLGSGMAGIGADQPGLIALGVGCNRATVFVTHDCGRFPANPGCFGSSSG